MTGCKATCPHCAVDVWWISGKELGDHIKACGLIEGGLFVADVESAVPVVEEKPEGWSWVPGAGEPG